MNSGKMSKSSFGTNPDLILKKILQGTPGCHRAVHKKLRRQLKDASSIVRFY
jgi:hypothetical protein